MATALRRAARRRALTQRRGLAAAPSTSEQLQRRVYRNLVLLRQNRVPALADETVRDMQTTYDRLDAAGRAAVVNNLATRFAEHPEALESLREVSLPEATIAQRAAVRSALHCGYEDIWQRIAQQDNGVRFLVGFRTDVLRARRREDAPLVEQLHRRLTEYIRLLFTAGLLQVRRLTWDSTSAELVDFLDRHERVHDAQGDLRQWRQRLGPGRRVYAIFHPALPEEPLVFIQVALTKGVPSSIHEVIGSGAAEGAVPEGEADSAIFYSISSCQPGLAGIDLGNTLIKGVVRRLQGDEHLPGLQNYVTLSPIPGFVPWLLSAAGGADAQDLAAVRDLAAAAGRRQAEGGGGLQSSEVPARLRADPELLAAAARLCRRYLLHERRPGGRGALDSVANFHLGNGASLWRLNPLADLSEAGTRRSLGFMVNYRYTLPDVPRNSLNYQTKGVIRHELGPA